MGSRALLPLACFLVACGGPVPAPDSGPMVDAYSPPIPDAGPDAPAPICTGSWWPGSLGAPVITHFEPVSSESAIPSGEVRLRHRTILARDGAAIDSCSSTFPAHTARSPSAAQAIGSR